MTPNKRSELARKVAHYQRMSARHHWNADKLRGIPEWASTVIHHQTWAAEYHRAAFGYLLIIIDNKE